MATLRWPRGILLVLLMIPAPTLAQTTDSAWRPVVYADRDPESGAGSLKVNAYLLSQSGHPRRFTFRELWRFDPAHNGWLRVDTVSVQSLVVLEPERRQVYSRLTDRQLLSVGSAAGLFWAKWEEEAHPAAALIFAGPVLCNDVELGEPPPGTIASCVPFRNRAEARFVPDPAQ